MIRKPVVAGQFYPSTAKELTKQIDSFIDKDSAKKDAIACMLPHAGYVYSGAVAADTISRVNIKDKVILLGPNHTGNGTGCSIMTQGYWQTPLGNVEIDSGLAKKILESSNYLEDDVEAHLYEHSLEVELPILQYFKQDFKIIPIAFLSQDLSILKDVAEKIAGAVKEAKAADSILIVASSDMTHYEAQKDAERKDKEAIDAILKLDEGQLYKKVKEMNISMCGIAPAIVMIVLAKALGAKSAKLIKYQTSGDITSDYTSVVGYAGITLY